MRAVLKSGDEHDALSRRAKRFFRWRSGQRRAAKRSFNRRARRQAAAMILAALVTGCADYQPTATLPAKPCPPLVRYTDAELDKALDERLLLPENSMVERMIDDYGTMRSLCR